MSMKYYELNSQIIDHFNSLEVGKLAFCFGRSNLGDLYSNLCYYRIVQKINNNSMCLYIEVKTEDCNEPEDERIYKFHPMQVYQINEEDQECLTKHYQHLKKNV